jgi:Tol biopolymer transport system component
VKKVIGGNKNILSIWKEEMLRMSLRFSRKFWSKKISLFLILCLIFSTVSPAYAQNTNENEHKQKNEISQLITNMMQSQADVDHDVSPWNKIAQISVKSTGEQGFGGHSFDPSINGDGRYVVFESNKALIENKNVNHNDIYIHDRLTGTTELISYALNQTYGNESSFHPAVSADGRFVAFASRASNLINGDHNEWEDIFVRDLNNRVTERISISTNGVESDDSSFYPTISGDGRYVAYESYATNLIDGKPVTSDASYIYLYDRSSEETIRIEVDGEPVKASSPQLSANGEFLVFSSYSSQIVPGDENNDSDIFLYHIESGEFERVSLTSSGIESNGRSSYPTISADGNYISFTSDASDLAEGTEAYKERIYLRNRLTGTTEHVTVGLNGADPDSYS